jgi:mono/diheme cytochrome c family protein
MPTRIVKRTSQENNTPLIISLLLLGGVVLSMFWIGDGIRSGDITATPGEQLYNQYCAACHGRGGEGNPTLGAPALNSTGTITQLTDGQIQRTIMTGGEIMPTHEQFLTTIESGEIIRYIQTWWTAEQLAGQQVLSQDDPLQP